MSPFRTVLVVLAVLMVMLSLRTALSEDELDRAISLAGDHRYEEARRVLDPLLMHDPRNLRARALHGVLRVHEGNTDDALAIFQQLTRDHPGMFEAHNNLAVLYAERGRFDEAREVLIAALEDHPVAVGYKNLADIYAELSRGAFARARELDLSETAAPVGREGPRAPSVDMAASKAPAPAVSAPLRLLGEEAAGTSKGTRPAIASTGLACVRAGEFTNPADVEEAAQWLRFHGAEAVHVTQQTRERIKSYRVYLPPFESRRSAVVKVRELRRLGISDVAVILKGGLKNAVSLGVYANKVNADRRAAKLDRLGYSVVLEVDEKTVDEHATIEARVGGALDVLTDAWLSRFPKYAIRDVACA